MDTPTSKGTPTTHRGNHRGDGHIKVVLRIRPPLPRELEGGKYRLAARVEGNRRGVILSENLEEVDVPGYRERDSVYRTLRFTFDYVHDQHDTQRDVYTQSARDAVKAVLSGYNATIIAYGQTGSGKTFTMEGNSSQEDLQGIIPRAILDIFKCEAPDQLIH